MSVTNYIWDELSDNVLMETDENDQTTAVYTIEPGQFGELISQRRADATSYYHFDGQGSTRQLTDANENVTDTWTYTGFGETVASSGSTTNRFGYVGALGYYVNPETNDVYVRARTYNPTQGRWRSVDPVWFRVRDAVINYYRHRYYPSSVSLFGSGDLFPYNRMDVNLYRYVFNSPLNESDPSGLGWWPFPKRPPIVFPTKGDFFDRKCWNHCKVSSLIQAVPWPAASYSARTPSDSRRSCVSASVKVCGEHARPKRRARPKETCA